jgi:hypothetical protein
MLFCTLSIFLNIISNKTFPNLVVLSSDVRHYLLSWDGFIYLVCEAIGTAATPGLLVPASGDSEDDCGEVDGM